MAPSVASSYYSYYYFCYSQLVWYSTSDGDLSPWTFMIITHNIFLLSKKKTPNYYYNWGGGVHMLFGTLIHVPIPTPLTISFINLCLVQFLRRSIAPTVFQREGEGSYPHSTPESPPLHSTELSVETRLLSVASFCDTISSQLRFQFLVVSTHYSGSITVLLAGVVTVYVFTSVLF